MKLLTIVAALLLSSAAHAQTVVHKPVTLLKISGSTKPIVFDRTIIDGDTIYTLTFQNWRYQQIADIKTLQLGKKELPVFLKAIATSQASAMDDKVIMPDYAIEKLRTGLAGATHYWISHDGGFCQLSEKDVRNLVEAIGKEK